MKLRLLILFIVICLTVFFRFFNMHHIMRLGGESQRLEERLQVETIHNRELWLTFNRLSSRERICRLATESLGMLFPSHTQQYSYTIRESGRSARDHSYSLVNFFIPSAQALTAELH
ncbi:MAG: hypothetical protein K8R90_11215 [Candidatus Cloacimonetes bacterium]|nr:hypothetical protein [Candidatus Cloacimonadota bacterium]